MTQKISSEARRYNHILAEIDTIYHELALKQGFSDSIMSILYTLSEYDGSCLLSDLIRRCAISKQTINSALRKLESDDIIYLEAAGKKAKRVLLTAKGREVVHATVDRVIAMENQIYGSWQPEEWAVYLDLTERFLQQLRKEVEDF